ncbi:MAG: hypothetical protein ABW133_09665, partial [Polyangiaceae bacterium]
ILGLVYEERGTAERMVAYKASHKDNSGAIDPAIAAATTGTRNDDPNGSAADAYTGKAHAGQQAPASNKKK